LNIYELLSQTGKKRTPVKQLPTNGNKNRNSKGRNENTGRAQLVRNQIAQRHNGILPCWLFTSHRIRESRQKSKMGFYPRNPGVIYSTLSKRASGMGMTGISHKLFVKK